MKTLAQIQREELERKAASALLAAGKLPTANDIQDWISKNHGDFVFGSPSCSIYLQERGGKLDWEKFFRFIETLGFDSNVAFRLSMDDARDLVNSAIQGSLGFDDLMARVSELEGRAARLAESYGSETPTTDRIPVDLGGASPAVGMDKPAMVDGKLAGVLLPISPYSTQRILTRTMSQAFMPSMRIMGTDAKNIVGSSNLPGQDFQSCVRDSSLPWLHQVVCNNFSGPLVVEASFQLEANSSDAPQLNRIDIEPAAGCRGKIEVVIQASGPNSLGKQVISGRKMIFPTRPLLAESMTIRFEMDAPSFTRGSMSTYIIGINALRLFNASYEAEGTFQTGWLVPQAKPYIGKATINAAENIPAGASIDWAVKFGNQFVETGWIPVVPMQREAPTSQKVATTQAAFSYKGPTVPIDASGAPDDNFPYLYSRRAGMDFYAIGRIPEDRFVDKAAPMVFRGIGQWEYTEDSNNAEQFIVRDYRSGNSATPIDAMQRLDGYVDEDVDVVTAGTQLGLQTAHKIDYIVGKNTVIPGSGAPIGPDGVHAVTSVLRMTPSGMEDLTEYVAGIGTGSDIYGEPLQNLILMKAGAELSQDDSVRVNYLAGPCSTFEIKQETVVVTANDKEVLPAISQDGYLYYASPTTHMNIQFTVKRYLSLLHVVTAWFRNDVDFVTDLDPGIGLLSGEGIWVDVGNGLKKADPGVTLDIRKGWHQVVIKAKSMERLKSLTSAKNSANAVLFTRGSFFSEQRALAAPLLYADPTVLYAKSLPGEQVNFSILFDGTIVVPFNPNLNTIVSPYYGIWKGEDNSAQAIVETFEICYNYVRTEEIEGRTDITPEVLSGQGVAIPLKSRHVYDRVSIKAVLKSSGESGYRMTPIIRLIAVDVQ